jgi:hypothetical protein
MPNTGGNQTSFFNDGGVGHGAFVADLAVAGFVVLESFSPDYTGKTIEQGNQIGAPLKQASIRSFDTASATAQIPVDNTGNTPTLVLQGDYFTAPAAYGGDEWYVEASRPAYAAGAYWKQELTLRKIYNGVPPTGTS